jgi:hypothetical protein
VTYAAEKIKSGRRPVTIVEIDLDKCANTYGVAPCTASGSAGDECYNTRITCQDTANFANTATLMVRFISQLAELPKDQAYYPYLKKVDITPSKLDLGKGIGQRANVTVWLEDHPHHDRGIDPYVSNRTYTPESQGTFFGKLLARNPYYQGRVMRIKTGYYTDPWDSANFETRTYFIDRIEGPDKKGQIKIIGKDLLKKIDDDKNTCPVATIGTLTADLASGTTSSCTVEGDADKYDTGGGRIRIGDEIIVYSSGSVAGTQFTFTTLSRGQDGTTAADHSTDDVVQLCVRYESDNVVDIVSDLLQNYGGIDSSYIPSTDWTTEKGLWLSTQNLTRTIAEPTGVKQLIEELTEQVLFNLWWDEVASEIKLEAIKPPDYSSVSTFTDAGNIIADSLVIKEDPRQRITEVWVFYAPFSQIDGSEAKHFSYLHVNIDSDAESADQYDESRIKKIFARWINVAGPAIQVAGRTLARFRDNAKIATFDLDAKDSGLWTGGLFYINTRKIQDVDGSNKLTLFQVLEVREAEQGTQYKYQAQNSSFAGRYGFVAPDATPDYSSASETEKYSYGFICLDTGLFSDGSDGYKII